MDKFDPIEVEHGTEKIRRRKSKAALNKKKENDGFRIVNLRGKLISSSSTSLDDRFFLKKFAFFKGFDTCLS